MMGILQRGLYLTTRIAGIESVKFFQEIELSTDITYEILYSFYPFESQRFSFIFETIGGPTANILAKCYLYDVIATVHLSKILRWAFHVHMFILSSKVLREHMRWAFQYISFSL